VALPRRSTNCSASWERHLASIEFLRAQRQEVALASYDLRMLEAARRLDIPIATL
jgi:hypothetical protein